MAELDLTNIANGSVAIPASGVSAFFVDLLTKLPLLKIDTGALQGSLSNQSVSTPVAGFAVDTYLVGSSIVVPNGFFRIGSLYKLTFDLTKTGAGTATLVLTIRIGILGTVADAAILVLTFAAGTAAIDTGLVEVLVLFRSVGSGVLAVVQGIAKIDHHLAATGLISTGAAGTGIIIGTSAGFDSTIANVIIGTSVNGGLAFAGTVTLVRAELVNL